MGVGLRLERDSNWEMGNGKWEIGAPLQDSPYKVRMKFVRVTFLNYGENC